MYNMIEVLMMFWAETWPLIFFAAAPAINIGAISKAPKRSILDRREQFQRFLLHCLWRNHPTPVGNKFVTRFFFCV